MTRKSAKAKAAPPAPPRAATASKAEPAARTSRKKAQAQTLTQALPPAPPRATAGERKAALKARSGVKLPPPVSEPASYPIGKGRKQLKGIAIYMHPLAKEALDRIARNERRTVQELGLEALNLLFRHYGEKPIA